MELIEFLNARLDRDEFDASDIHTIDCAIHRSYPDSRIDCHCGWPARVLAEVEAKRRILALHRLDTLGVHDFEGNLLSADFCTVCQIDFPCPTLRMLSLAYVGHPDYREEWRP